MKQFKQYIALFLVLCIAVAGCGLLAMDKGWWSLLSSFVCFGVCLALGRILVRKHILPE